VVSRNLLDIVASQDVQKVAEPEQVLQEISHKRQTLFIESLQ
jgi:hypothetical protein